MLCWQRAPENRPSFSKITAAITALQMVGWDDMSEPIEHAKQLKPRPLTLTAPYGTPSAGILATATGTLTKNLERGTVLNSAPASSKETANKSATRRDDNVAVSDADRTSTLWKKTDASLTFLPRGVSSRQQAWADDDDDEIAERRV